MKATYQIVLFHCALSVANNLQTAAMTPENWNDLITNHTHMTSKSGDHFKWILESQCKQSKAFVSKVTISEKLRKQVI
jgi:hypothetical protein